MEKDVTISARVSSELAGRINLLSKQYRRSRSWLVEDALSSYVDSQLRFAVDVHKGLDALERGEIVSHEEVVAACRKRIKKYQH